MKVEMWLFIQKMAGVHLDSEALVKVFYVQICSPSAPLFLSIILGVCGCSLRGEKEVEEQASPASRSCSLTHPPPQLVIWQGEPREHPHATGPVGVL